MKSSENKESQSEQRNSADHLSTNERHFPWGHHASMSNTGSDGPPQRTGAFTFPLLQFKIRAGLSANAGVGESVIQRDVTPSTPSNPTYNQIMRMTLLELDRHLQAQADWFRNPNLNDTQKETLRFLLRVVNTDVVATLGNISVRSINALISTQSSEVNDENAESIRIYCGATAGERLPFRMDHDSSRPLTTIINIGKDIKRLKEVFPGHVLNTAMTSAAFFLLQRGGHLESLINYFMHADQTPIFQAENGADFESFYYLIHNDGVDPLNYDATVLKGKIRNYHRFTKALLNKLIRNYQNTNQVNPKPLTLILHTALDHNGAFHRDPNLYEVVNHPNMHTIMVEGYERLSDYTAQIASIAQTYGVHGRIDQVMIAGHGNSRSMQLAGTVEENITSPNSLSESDDAIDMDQMENTRERNRQLVQEYGFDLGPSDVELLFREILHFMDDNNVPATERQQHSRIVFNACLTGSNEVATALDANDPVAARAAARTYLQDHPGLANSMQRFATDENRRVTSIGANGSFGQVALVNSSGSLDIIDNNPDRSSRDRSITAPKIEYVERGLEPIGALRAVMECWTADGPTTFQAMERRNSRGNPTDWYGALIFILYKLILENYRTNGEKIAQFGRLASILSEMSIEPYCRVTSSMAAYLQMMPSRIGASDQNAIFTNLKRTSDFEETYVKLAFYPVWSITDSTKEVDLMRAIDRTNCNMSNLYVPIPFLENNGKMASLLSGTPNGAKLKLALLGVLRDNRIAAAITYLNNVRGGAQNFPASANLPRALGGATTETAILERIGASTPSNNQIANVRSDNQSQNTAYVRSQRFLAKVALPATSVYANAELDGTPIGYLAENDYVDVVGTFSMGYAIEYQRSSGSGSVTGYVFQYNLRPEPENF